MTDQKKPETIADEELDAASRGGGSWIKVPSERLILQNGLEIRLRRIEAYNWLKN